MKKLTLFSLLIISVIACKKKDNANSANVGPTIQTPIDSSNGWELLDSKYADDVNFSPSQSYPKIEYIKTHGNIADIFLSCFNAISTTTSGNRWQIDLNSKSTVKLWKDLYVIFDQQKASYNLGFRSLSTAENDFEFVRSDGYYKGNSSIVTEAFYQNNDERSFTNKFPVGYTNLLDKVILQNTNFAKVKGSQYPFIVSLLSEAYWATQKLATLEYNGKVYVITIDNDANNPIKIYQSLDTLFTGYSNVILEPSYPFELKKTYKNILSANTLTYKGIKPYLFKDGNLYKLCLEVSTSSTSNEKDIYNLTFNPNDLSIVQNVFAYPNLNVDPNNTSFTLLDDRLGHFLKLVYSASGTKPTSVYYLDGVSENLVKMPKLKPTANSFDYGKTLYYNSGRLFLVVSYNNYVHILSKKI